MIDLWNIFIMVSKGKILVLKENDRFWGGIDLGGAIDLGYTHKHTHTHIYIYIYSWTQSFL